MSTTIWAASAVTPAGTDRIPVDVSGAGGPSRWTGQQVADVNTLIGGTVTALGSIGTNTAINLALGGYFSATITGNLTFSITNVPASAGVTFVLALTNGGAFTVTLPGSVTIIGGSPVLSAAGTDWLVFRTLNGGTAWTLEVVGNPRDADLATWATITPGTGVGTALAVNVGTAGAFVTNGGALGTPSSGTLTNCTFPTLNQNTSGYAEALKSATTTVTVSTATAPSSGQVLTATSGTAANWQTPSGGSSNTKWVGAGELIPRVTNGAGIDGEELATNDINLDYLAFDSATSEGAQVSFAWPGAYTTFTAQFHWTAASGSGTVTWTAAARCYADDDALDQAQGTAQSVTDTLLAANDAHKSSATSAVTPGGTVAAGNLCVAQFTRDIADTLAVDARLIGVLLSFA